MITETEKERLKAIREDVHRMTDRLIDEFGADPDDAALKAEATGAQLATLDALFAIREGTEWRGMTDPKEIARAVLRESQIGE